MYSKQMPNFIDIPEKSTIFTQKLKKKEHEQEHTENLLKNLKIQNDQVEQDRQHLTLNLKTTKEKLKQLQTLYKPRNVKRREETKEKHIMQLKYRLEKKSQEIKSLTEKVDKNEVTIAQAVKEAVQQAEMKKDAAEKQATELKRNVEKLQQKFRTEKNLKQRAQKRASKWRRKAFSYFLTQYFQSCYEPYNYFLLFGQKWVWHVKQVLDLDLWQWHRSRCKGC